MRRFCKRHEYEAVPCGEYLRVRPQLAARGAVEAQLLAEIVIALGEEIPAGVYQKIRNAAAVEIALGRDVVALAEVPPGVIAEDLFHLVRGKEIICALNAAAVRILTAVIPALRGQQLAHAVVECALGHIAVERHAAALPRLNIGVCKQRVVVQRLFKVRREPFAVGGVARKTAAEMVEYAALIHRLERILDHCAGLFIA